MEIGFILRQAREEKGFTLEQVEEKTKIRRKYIEALENENFAVLPGTVYVKAFIKTYAKYLGLDGELLVSGLSGDIAGEEEATSSEEPEQTGHKKKFFSLNPRYWAYSAVVFLIGMGVLFGVAYKQNNLYQDPAPHRQLKQSDRGGESNKGTVENSENAAEKNQDVSLKLNVTSDKSWVVVKVDGNTAFEGILLDGQYKNFTARENVWFRLGNTGVVQVFVNGKNMGYLGERGAVENFNVDNSGIIKIDEDKSRTT